MTEQKKYDTLSEFHLRNPDTKIYALIAHIVYVLEQIPDGDREQLQRNLSNLLGEAESMRILQLICHKQDIDYLALMQKCQSITIKHISPRLLLHIMCLPVPYVAQKLEIDQERVFALLQELHAVFTIDDPIYWLKMFLAQTEKDRLYLQQAKQDLLHGLAVVNQPVDTAEERRIRERKFHLRYKPPYEP